jgi:hypothetical protein
MPHRKIDRTLQERHSILNLLEKLNRDSITVGEMEDIGMKLQKEGKRALPPLVRKLWREKNGDILSRYAYLLDFFEDDIWLDQLVRITLTRDDLETDAKSALLAALENYGIDVTAPPFSRILHEVGGPLKLTLPRVLNKGEQGYILFMEDFCGYPPQVQCSIIRELPEVDEAGIFQIFSMLLGFDNPVVVREAVTTLGKTRDQRAVPLLRRFIGKGESELGTLARRSLKRLSFLGFDVTSITPDPYHDSFHASFVTPFDGTGNRSLWICRERRGEPLFDLLFLQLHEREGILDAISYGALGVVEYEALLAEIGEEERLLPVTPDYALQLLGDALFLSREQELELPAEYFVRGAMFGDREIVPTLRIPNFDRYDLERITATPRRLAESAQLLDDPFFCDWFLATPAVYDLAEEWGAVVAVADRHEREHAVVAKGIMERFCRELITPDLDRITRRLFLTADLMQETGEEAEQVERTLAVALSISGSRLPAHAHPFLRRLALESLEAAREALAEGYDLRTDPYLDEFDE